MVGKVKTCSRQSRSRSRVSSSHISNVGVYQRNVAITHTSFKNTSP